MGTRVTGVGALLLPALLGLPGCGSGAAGTATALADLPLKPGFFVASDTPCEQASNATLLLKRPGGFNGSRDYCDFKAVEQTGPHSYSVTESCGEFQGGAGSEFSEHTTWEIPDEARFHSRSASGWERNFRHCEQASLPEPWRDNDLGDAAGAAAAR